MARNDWTALVTEPAQEYSARVDLERFGLHPYLPQLSRPWVPPHGGTLPRRCPLFPRYLLLPIAEAEHRALRYARGLRKIRPVLANDEGRPWRCPARVVDALMRAEHEGAFDEIILVGDQVKLTGGILSCISAKMARREGDRSCVAITARLAPTVVISSAQWPVYLAARPLGTEIERTPLLGGARSPDVGERTMKLSKEDLDARRDFITRGATKAPTPFSSSVDFAAMYARLARLREQLHA